MQNKELIKMKLYKLKKLKNNIEMEENKKWIKRLKEGQKGVERKRCEKQITYSSNSLIYLSVKLSI